MTIELYSFDPPLNVSDTSEITIRNAVLFGKKETIPSGDKRDITPSGYRDRYDLKTLDNPNSKAEDTVADIEAYPKVGHPVSTFEVDGITGAATLTENPEPKVIRRIDAKQPLFVLARPNVLDDKKGKGIRVDRLVVYTRQSK